MNISKVFSILDKEVKQYSAPVIDLIEVQTNDPFKVLVGTILSARTKDEVTSQAAEKLFKKIKKVSDFNKFTQKQIEELIYPVGFYITKAKHLKELPKHLKNKIPDTIEELVKLPGVGRKTANLVMSVAHKKNGICVDTHVHKIMNRLGYVKTKNPYETEKVLREILPLKHWRETNFLLVAFGQNLCRPTSPHCSKCPIIKHCKRIGVKISR